jgi:hypothetical protein
MIVFFIFLSIFLLYYYIKIIKQNKEHLTINEEHDTCNNNLCKESITKMEILLNMNQKIDDNRNKITEIMKEIKKIPYIESEINEYNKVFTDESIKEEDNNSLIMDYKKF